MNGLSKSVRISMKTPPKKFNLVDEVLGPKERTCSIPIDLIV
jgi:hypothetical protein